MLFNPLISSLCFEKPQRLTDITSWHEHIPFAFTIVQMLKPTVFVELGTYKGDSYCAFCQAIDELGLDAACYAIDTWEGEEHSGFYGKEILEELRSYHDPLYGRFSRLVQSRFDQAIDHFLDGSIDLLHIDGLHTYEAVKHDFETWLPKMSKRSVILFHDTNVRERGFGVWRLWQEQKKKYPNLEFKHEHGLGVLAIGSEVPGEILDLLDPGKNDAIGLTKFFSHLGNNITRQFELQRKSAQILELHSTMQTRDAKIVELTSTIQAKDTQVNELTNTIQARNAQVNELTSTIQARNAQVNELTNTIQARNTQLNELTNTIQARNTQLNELANTIQAKDAQVNELTNTIQAKNAQINDLTSTKNTQINELSNTIQAKNTQVNELTNTIQTRDAQIVALTNMIQARDAQVNELTSTIQAKDSHINELAYTTHSLQQMVVLRLYFKYKNGVERVLPLGTRRRGSYDFVLNNSRILVNEGVGSLWRKAKKKITKNKPVSPEIKNDIGFLDFYRQREKGNLVKKHVKTVDVIICVHNAFEDIKKCLESVIKFTNPPYSIILVDDGSSTPTKSYLEDFARTYGTQLIRNEIAKGYTFASNQGLRSSTANYVVLLNSDTSVSTEWLDMMIECAESDERVGIVGPLSNTASWQSVPEIEGNGDWAQNDLPPDLSIEQMGELIARYSARLYPEIPFLNGFCLLIKRDLINDIGYFDEELFGKGYGEENDYCIRARKSGWNLRVADDVYIYHAQSRSYSNDKRKELCKRADVALLNKHGKDIINEGVANCRYNRVLAGIRERTKALFIRQQLIKNANNRWKGKRILIILPVMDAGGGAYVVIQEGKALLSMGTYLCLLNLPQHKEKFERNYPDIELPVIYSQVDEVGIITNKFDAVISTLNSSVAWVESIIQKDGKPVRGYYIQDFEPHFYQEGSKEFNIAWESYTKFPDLVRITKTRWNEEIVKEKIGVNSHIVGPSVDIDLFRPRPRSQSDPQNRPIYIGAMIRPSSPRRGPLQTINILREIEKQYKDRVKIIIFGCTGNDLDSLNFLNDFNYYHMDVLNRKNLAFLMNELDIFVDFSSYQAMGLTALEAMACGATVIVPKAGGTKEFVRHEFNGLVVDTSSEKVCLEALNRLVIDNELRIKLGIQAMKDACQFPPEKAAYNTLMALFNKTH